MFEISSFHAGMVLFFGAFLGGWLFLPLMQMILGPVLSGITGIAGGVLPKAA